MPRVRKWCHVIDPVPDLILPVVAQPLPFGDERFERDLVECGQLALQHQLRHGTTVSRPGADSKQAA